MNKRWLWPLVLIPMVITYGAMYADAQSVADGYLSHIRNASDHMMALDWAIFPPMWIIAPFFTKGYEHGLQFRHHHVKFCDPVKPREGPCEER
jgi:hypothetical protein